MRLLIRLAGGTGLPVDLRLSLAEDVTVGELADHLCSTRTAHRTAQGALTLAGGTDDAPVLDRSSLVAEVGPRSGTTVRLVPDRPSPPVERPPSPVELVPADGEPLRVPYGRSTVEGATVEVTDRVEVRAAPGVTPTVDGAPVLGSARLGRGDLLGVGARTFEVRQAAPLRPPAPGGPTVPVHRTPALRSVRASAVVELPVPPSAMRLPGFPVLSASVPLLMGAGLWAVTRSIASAVFVLFSFVFVVASGIESRKEARAEARFREEEFRADVDDCRDRVDQLRRDEGTTSAAEAPHVDEVLRIVAGRADRLWERGADVEGLARVRLGTALQSAADRVVVPSHGRRELLAELRGYAEDVQHATLPVTVDLIVSHGLALVGAGELPTALARSVVIQLAALVGPDDLEILTLTAPDRAARWSWCGWLPHVAPEHPPSTLLVVVDGGDPVELARMVDTAGRRRVAVLWLSAARAGLPDGLRAVLHTAADDDARFELVASDGTVEVHLPAVRTEGLGEDDAEAAARALAPLHPAPRLQLRGADTSDGDSRVRSDALPNAVGLEDLVEELADRGDDAHEAVARRWDLAARAGSLGAPVGSVAGGALNVDLRLDGPHALVAGTTGSGKSELLRTLVASLALHNGPDRLTFLLVDYKGGAAFGPLTSLPHTVGMVTDLSGSLAQRALRSLRAEVRRREEVLADHGAADLAELDAAAVPGRPPALAVVVDEFAALARELPEFVDGLVDLAQRGRSLGVHLVLATQRPAGVVTDAIRANTTLRMALRVTDEDDSRDVVDHPGAAHLSRDVPGRAFVRLGPGRRALAQVAWSGQTLGARRRIASSVLGGPPPERRDATTPAASAGGGRTVLQAAVAATTRAADHAGTSAPRRPWVDALPDRADSDALPPHPGPGRVHIGWIDRPDLQRRDPLLLDLHRDGGALVLGASGSGRSTALCTIARALVDAPGPTPCVHAIDSGRGLAALSDVVDVIASDDAERVLRLLRALQREVAERRDGSTPGAVDGHSRIVLLDGFAPFEEVHERVNRGEAVELLTRLARDGRSAGIHVLVAANRRSEVPVALAAALGLRLQLRCSSEDDALMAGLPAGAADPSTPPGRGHLGAEEVQLAVAAASAPAAASQAERVPTLPSRVSRADLAPSRGDSCPPWRLPLGLDAERLGIASIDLEHHHAVVAGPPRSGVSSTLRMVATVAESCFLIAARATPNGPWTGHDSSGRSERWAELVEAATRSAQEGRRTVLCVDDLPELLDRPDGPGLEAHLERLRVLAHDQPLRLVVGGEIDSLARCYSELVTALRSGRTGVLLQPDRDLHPSLLHASLPLREELPMCPGRGWMLGPGTAIPLQVALL